ncbi:uncharacterized protein BDV17DRAFT_291505 [Aspergillus undulatus]|uniref:uncharacterized protein n=1 Tax=Aspergillus undulatus TaxID=1810928 RepID=UPI003CCDF54E
MDWTAMVEHNAGVNSKGTAQMAIVVRVVVLVLAILTTLVCGLRLYLRKFILRCFGLDDFLVILALTGVNGFSALAYTITYYGLGADTEDVSAQDFLIWFKIYFGAECSYLPLEQLSKSVSRCSSCVSFRQSPFALQGYPSWFLQRASYDKSITDAKCWSPDMNFAVLMSQGVIMFVLDVIILALPIRPIWKLQVHVRKRLMVTGLFAVGFIACIAALVRFSTLVYANDEINFTKSAATSLIWMEVEFNLALTSGSLSSLPKLFKRYQNRSSLSLSSYPLPSPSRNKSSATIDTKPLSISSEMWIKGIRKKTEITRVSEMEERDTSRERIAPDGSGGQGVIYGAGEVMTMTSAYSGVEQREKEKGRERSHSRSQSRRRREEKERERKRREYEEFDFGWDSS